MTGLLVHGHNHALSPAQGAAPRGVRRRRPRVDPPAGRERPCAGAAGGRPLEHGTTLGCDVCRAALPWKQYLLTGNHMGCVQLVAHHSPVDCLLSVLTTVSSLCHCVCCSIRCTSRRRCRTRPASARRADRRRRTSSRLSGTPTSGAPSWTTSPRRSCSSPTSQVRVAE
jgi:hypothetical protein